MPSGVMFGFGPYLLDVRARTLCCRDTPLSLSVRQFDLLHALVAAAPAVVSKDRLIEIVWHGTAVGDSSLEKQIGYLRRLLDATADDRYIRTVPRLGYQFVETVSPIESARADVDVYAILAPHRAWFEGVAALETLEVDRVADARTSLEQLVRHHPTDARFHVGLATACALQFESTRTDDRPNIEALHLAARSAHEACRLAPDLATAWTTLGFVLSRVERLPAAARPEGSGDRIDSAAALQHAVTLEPEIWMHVFRQADASWGLDRLRAARRALALYSGFPMAHWLAATVYVAHADRARAECDIDAALTSMAASRPQPGRFAPVAIHLLKGMLCLARGANDDGIAALRREIAIGSGRHLYAKECGSNAYYVIGAEHWHRGESAAARTAFEAALALVPRHGMALAGLDILSGAPAPPWDEAHPHASVGAAMAQAARLHAAHDTVAAARILGDALAAAPPGLAGWTIPIDPLLRVWEAPEVWAGVLQILRDRAS